MKTKYFGKNEIKKARKLQNDCLKLNLLPPTIGILTIEKLDKNKEIAEKIIMKSNSFIRNAYNLLQQVIFSTQRISTTEIPTGYDYYSFGMKRHSGSIERASNNYTLEGYNVISIGSNGKVDEIDDYSLLSLITTTTNSNSIITGEYQGKKLITRIKRTFININTSPIIVRESGIYKLRYADESPVDYYGILLIRDVFPEVTLNQFEGITITYELEFVYP